MSAFRWVEREAPRRLAGDRKAERAARPDRRRRCTEPGPPVGPRSTPPDQPSLLARAARRRPDTAATSSARVAGAGGRHDEAAHRHGGRRHPRPSRGSATRREGADAWVGFPPPQGFDTTRPTSSSLRQPDRARRPRCPAASGCCRAEPGGCVDYDRGRCGAATLRRRQPDRRRAAVGTTSDGARRLELGDHSRNLARAATCDELERLAVVERLDRLRHPDGDVLRMDDAG